MKHLYRFVEQLIGSGRDASLRGRQMSMTRFFVFPNLGTSLLSKQLLRSGTSVGAMVREAGHAQTKADFIHNLSIAQKEINERIYWLDLLAGTDYLTPAQGSSLCADATELMKLLTAIIKTTKNNLNN